MQLTYQSLPSPPPPPPPPAPSPPRQNKVVLQREYREKEGECFNILRDIIKDLTGAELRTRQEILRKAIDILSTASEIQRHRGTQVGALPAQEIHVPANHEGTTSRTTNYPTPSPHFPEGWQSSYADFDAANLYDTAHFHDQQYYSMSDVGSAPNQTYCQEHDKDWSNFRQL